MGNSRISDDIYDEMEVNYLSSLLQKKLYEHDIVPESELHDITQKSLRTLKNLMNILLLD